MSKILRLALLLVMLLALASPATHSLAAPPGCVDPQTGAVTNCGVVIGMIVSGSQPVATDTEDPTDDNCPLFGEQQTVLTEDSKGCQYQGDVITAAVPDGWNGVFGVYTVPPGTEITVDIVTFYPAA